MVTPGSSVGAGDLAEVILYATPDGPLADRCERFFESSTRRLGPTTAHTYPPHISLTGFFHRSPHRLADLIASVNSPGPPPGRVQVTELAIHDGWVGLVIDSPWLLQLTAAFADRDEPVGAEDPIRLKTWLHLSLAYGSDQASGAAIDVVPYAELAARIVDPSAAARWRVGLWRRHHSGGWDELS